MWLVQWIKSNTKRNEFGIPIRNFAKVTDGIYRGALPHRDGYLALVERLGVRRVCDLRLAGAEHNRQTALDAGLVEWNHIAFSDREAPRMEPVREWLNLMRTASPENPIYTHCMGGRHRTGVLIAVLRVTDLGWTVEQALKEMLKHGWYDALGHRPLLDWFLHDFDPKDYADAASPGMDTPSELSKSA